MSKRKIFILLAAAMAAIGAAAVVYLFDPMSGGFPYPRCMFKLLTGLDCPGCGSTRALHALLHGRIADAARANPAIFVALPLIGACFLAEMPRCQRLRRRLFTPTAAAIIIAATLAWTILRNLLP